SIKYSYFFFSSRRRHTRSKRDWSSDVCSSDLILAYAKGLVNLSCEQSLEERIETIARLEQLTQTYAHNEGIVLEYAKGLFNLSKIGRASCRGRVYRCVEAARANRE